MKEDVGEDVKEDVKTHEEEKEANREHEEEKEANKEANKEPTCEFATAKEPSLTESPSPTSPSPTSPSPTSPACSNQNEGQDATGAAAEASQGVQGQEQPVALKEEQQQDEPAPAAAKKKNKKRAYKLTPWQRRQCLKQAEQLTSMKDSKQILAKYWLKLARTHMRLTIIHAEMKRLRKSRSKLIGSARAILGEVLAMDIQNVPVLKLALSFAPCNNVLFSQDLGDDLVMVPLSEDWLCTL